MPYCNKYFRIPLLLVLLFGSAQPGPNFFACVVRMHDLAIGSPKKDCCSHEARPCKIPGKFKTAASLKSRPYLPCCDSVLPSSSVSEDDRIGFLHAIIFISSLAGMELPKPRIVVAEWCFVPPPVDVGKEILVRNLRI